MFNAKNKKKLLKYSIIVVLIITINILLTHAANSANLIKQNNLPSISILFGSLLFNILLAFGEEVGWRGYLFNRFNTDSILSFFEANAIVGFVWGFWHFPLLNFQITSLAIFIIKTTALSIIFSWVFLKTGNVLSCAIGHGFYNFYLNNHNNMYYSTNQNFVLIEIAVLALISAGIYLKLVHDRRIKKKNAS